MNDRFKFRVWWESPYTNVSSKFLYYDPHKNNYETDIIRDADCDFVEDIVYYDLRDIILGNIDEYTRPGTFTVEQCTGLKDKNGNLIYESDLVRGAENIIGIVKYGKHPRTNSDSMELGFYIEWQMKYPYRSDICYWTSPENKDCIEIIGNIHEQKDGE